ncbi:MAG TPA: ATP phosphoribosyltransferase [Spirochaetota bacterium]|nr:ATP phosphoribosyltransferase [Spirochaetota bacterium]
MTSPNTLRFAVPNKGRLKEPALSLLRKAGYKFRLRERALYATCSNADIIFIFVRTADIPQLIAGGAADMGITGEDLIEESGVKLHCLLPLDFGKCRLCIAGDASVKKKDLFYFKNSLIATSFPAITKKFFQQQKIKVSVLEMNGSVELMTALGRAKGIVDVVETGDSLKAHNLEIFSEIGEYQSVLACTKKMARDPRLLRIRRRLEGIIIAAKYSILEYNIMEKDLPQAARITPGFESPTVSRLEEKDWLAVKVMALKKEIPVIMDKLEHTGATAIIETEIKNCRL